MVTEGKGVGMANRHFTTSSRAQLPFKNISKLEFASEICPMWWYAQAPTRLKFDKVFPEERRCYTVSQCWNQPHASSAREECFSNLTNFIWGFICLYFFVYLLGGFLPSKCSSPVCPGKVIFQNSHQDFSAIRHAHPVNLAVEVLILQTSFCFYLKKKTPQKHPKKTNRKITCYPSWYIPRH